MLPKRKYEIVAPFRYLPLPITYVLREFPLTYNAKQALRLYPQLPINVRFATRMTMLPRGGGPDGTSPVLIRKGEGLGWSAYHLHRKESIYGPDAEVYRPSRWEGGELQRRAGIGGFLDFHAGPRVCLGSKCSSRCPKLEIAD